jgi:hypothetical protein
MINSTLVKKLEPEYVVDKYGDKRSFNSNGNMHSFDDNPAVISKNGNKFWFKDGLLHRDNDLPAVILNNGDKEWWVNDKRIRRERA